MGSSYTSPHAFALAYWFRRSGRVQWERWEKVYQSAPAHFVCDGETSCVRRAEAQLDEVRNRAAQLADVPVARVAVVEVDDA